MPRRITSTGESVKPPKTAKTPTPAPTPTPPEQPEGQVSNDPQPGTPPPVEQPPAAPGTEGVTFVNNQPNRILKFKDGTTYQFRESAVTITDPTLIANLRDIGPAKRIFEA